MTNHGRNLLLNMLGNMANAYSPAPGEEYVDPAYRPISPPSWMTKIRNLLFGVAPDRLYMNFRVRQYLTLIHSCELGQFLFDLDPRITYLPFKDNDSLFSAFGITVTQVAGSYRPCWVSGQPYNPDAAGQSEQQWEVQAFLGPGTATISRQVLPLGSQVFTWESAGELSDPLPLAGSALFARFRASFDPSYDTDPTWHILSRARPQLDIGEIAVRIEQVLDDATASQLFGLNPPEPYKTFQNLWQQHPQLAYKLGGLLLALIYRANGLLGAP